jgi:hypothetical protein
LQSKPSPWEGPSKETNCCKSRQTASHFGWGTRSSQRASGAASFPSLLPFTRNWHWLSCGQWGGMGGEGPSRPSLSFSCPICYLEL